MINSADFKIRRNSSFKLTALNSLNINNQIKKKEN